MSELLHCGMQKLDAIKETKKCNDSGMYSRCTAAILPQFIKKNGLLNQKIYCTNA